jgi:ubiquinone/menaquinone biosynthesis C-methylase UbiE
MLGNTRSKDIPNFKFLQCDATKENLPFHDENFDIVLLIDALEHPSNPSFMMKGISRILKNNGLLVIRTPNCANLKQNPSANGKKPLSRSKWTVIYGS